MNATTDTIQTEPKPQSGEGRSAPLTLWRVAEAFMHILHALFGDPSDVAARHTLTLKAHQLMASWLRAGEAMMRRLLLIEAAAYARPNIRPLLRTPRKRTRRLGYFYADAPQDWRVRFRCFHLPRGPSPSKAGASAALPPDQVRSQGSQPRPFIFREDRPLRGLSPRKTNRRARRANRKRAKPMLRQDREWIKHQPPLAFRSAWGLAIRYEALRRAFNNPDALARRLSRHLHATPHRARELFRGSAEAARRVDRFADFSTAGESAALRFNSS